MKVRVRTSTSAIAKVSFSQRATVSVGIQGPAGYPGGMGSISDVDLTNLEDGAVLVYSSASGKWVAQTILNKQQVDIGDESF